MLQASHDVTTEPKTMKQTSKKRKKVFICSPFATVGKTEKDQKMDLTRNIALARRACRHAANKGFIPYAPHLYFTQFLHDFTEERALGMSMGMEWLSGCSEIWVIGTRISKGMEVEINNARERGIPVRFFFENLTPEQRLINSVLYPNVKIELLP